MVGESGPNVSTSKRRVVYRRSAWATHEFEVWSGELVTRVAALRTAGQLLLWLGGAAPAGQRELGELAAGVPPRGSRGADRGSAAATALLGSEGAESAAAALARRLAAALRRPVLVCCASSLDARAAPLVARGLAAEIKSHPEFFDATEDS